MRIATWNLNTWINRKNGIDNSTLWSWADDNLAADLVVFTEAATPPPPVVRAQGWSVVHRPGGFPNRSNWGTLIAGRNMRIEHLTHVGKKKYELDTKFPGSLTATDVWVINNKTGSSLTVTLPAPSTNTGRILTIQNYQVQTVISASSNVVPQGGGAAGTAILAASAGDSAVLVSNGTSWVMMQYASYNNLLLE